MASPEPALEDELSAFLRRRCSDPEGEMAYLVDLADDIRRRSRPTAEDALVEWVEGERVWTAATLEPLSCPLPVDMATKPDDGRPDTFE